MQRSSRWSRNRQAFLSSLLSFTVGLAGGIGLFLLLFPRRTAEMFRERVTKFPPPHLGQSSTADTGAASLCVREVSGSELAKWDGYVAAAPGGGHFLQCYQWGEFKRGQDWEPVRLLLERDGKPVGAAQVFCHKFPGGFLSLLYVPKGPCLDWHDSGAAQVMLAALEALARMRRAAVLKIEPEVTSDDEQAITLLAARGYRTAPVHLQFKCTMTLDLGKGEAALQASFKSKTRYNIGLAQRKGVEVRSTTDPASFEVFYAMFLETNAREHLPVRTKDYYYQAWSRMLGTGQGRLFLGYFQGEPLGGALVFTFGKKCWYMYGASRNLYRNLMPNHLVQWEVMRWAISQGCTFYDLVAIPCQEDDTSDSLYGLYQFKAGFNGQRVEFLGTQDYFLSTLWQRYWLRLEHAYMVYLKRVRQRLLY